jgi:hypothetical protein
MATGFPGDPVPPLIFSGDQFSVRGWSFAAQVVPDAITAEQAPLTTARRAILPMIFMLLPILVWFLSRFGKARLSQCSWGLVPVVALKAERPF